LQRYYLQTYKQLVAMVANSIGISKRAAKYVMDAVPGVVRAELACGREVLYSRLGKFKIRHLPERMQYLPRSGERKTVRAKNRPAFRSAEYLTRINPDDPVKRPSKKGNDFADDSEDED
jgi:nucleoid DNA-binding protein